MTRNIAANTTEQEDHQKPKPAKGTSDQRTDQGQRQEVCCQMDEIEMYKDGGCESPKFALIDTFPSKSAVVQKVRTPGLWVGVIESEKIEAFEQEQIDQNGEVEGAGGLGGRLPDQNRCLQEISSVFLDEQLSHPPQIPVVDQ